MAEKSVLEVRKMDLENLKPKFQALMKDDTDKFVQIASNYLEQNPKLLECSSASFFAAVTKAAQCGLFIDGQEASIVPFKGTATMMTGYKGILKMVRNSGELASINAGVVYEKDTFEYYVDEKGEHLMHRPAFVKERGAPIQTYCIARTKGNTEPYIEVMHEEEVENCKKQSAAVKGGYDTPWKGPFADEMRKKTVIRRISKRLPMSTDLNMAITSDDALFNAPVDEPAPSAEPKTTSSSLEKAVGAEQPAPHPLAGQGTGPRLAKEEPAPAVQTAAPANQVTDKQVEDMAKRNVEGVIEHISAKDYPEMKDPAKRRRFACKISGVFYGTWDAEKYKNIETFYNQKVEVSITFMVMKNSKNQHFNEILDVVAKVADEEVPI